MQFSCIKLRPHEKNAAFRPRGCMKIQSGLLLLRPYKKPQPLRRVFSAGTAAFSLALHKAAPRKNALFQQKILRRMAVSRDSPQTKSAGNPLCFLIRTLLSPIAYFYNSAMILLPFRRSQR